MNLWQRTIAFSLLPAAALVLVIALVSASDSPSIKVSPGEVSPGGAITMSGKDWPDATTLRIASSCITNSPLTVDTSSGGSFSVDARLEESASGKCTIEVCALSEGTYGRCRNKTFTGAQER